jgi:polyisoprenyl-phosphate glycosyltransferase
VKISVLIPAFNEAPSVGAVVQRVRQVMDSRGDDYEVLVIDDGSSDGTAAAAAAAGATVIAQPKNGGYGLALKTGLRKAQGDFVAIADADGSYPIDSLPALLDRVPRFDMVVGARSGSQFRGSPFKWWGRCALHAMVHFVTGTRVPDVNSGMRVFRRDIAMRSINQIGNGFSFTTTLTLAMLLNSHFVEYVSIDYLKRAGASKVRIGRDTLRTLQILVMAIVAYNPIKMFLLLIYIQLLALLPAVALDLILSQGGHAGVILIVASSSSLLLLGLGLVSDLLRRLPTA